MYNNHFIALQTACTTTCLHWDRILVGVTCCVVTVTRWVLCIWQLLRFKAGKELFYPIWPLWVLFPFLKYLSMTADKHYYIHVACFSGGNIFLLTIMFKEAPQTMYAAVKQNRVTNNLWSVFVVMCTLLMTSLIQLWEMSWHFLAPLIEIWFIFQKTKINL